MPMPRAEEQEELHMNHVAGSWKVTPQRQTACAAALVE